MEDPATEQGVRYCRGMRNCKHRPLQKCWLLLYIPFICLCTVYVFLHLSIIFSFIHLFIVYFLSCLSFIVCVFFKFVSYSLFFFFNNCFVFLNFFFTLFCRYLLWTWTPAYFTDRTFRWTIHYSESHQFQNSLLIGFILDLSINYLPFVSFWKKVITSRFLSYLFIIYLFLI